MMTLGEKIDLLLRLRHRTQGSLVTHMRELGHRVSPSAVSRWVRGENEPNLHDLRVIAESLNTPLSWFFDPTSGDPPTQEEYTQIQILMEFLGRNNLSVLDVIERFKSGPPATVRIDGGNPVDAVEVSRPAADNGAKSVILRPRKGRDDMTRKGRRKKGRQPKN